MKVNNYPEDLDVIINFEKGETLIFSKSPSFNTPIVKISGIRHNFSFGLTFFKDEKTAVTTSYNFVCDKDECNITKKDELITSYDEKGLTFNLNGKNSDIDGIKNFVKSIGENTPFLNAIITLSFDAHKNRVGFNDVYLKLRSCYSRYHNTSFYGEIVFYYYYSTPEMFAVAERLIKLGMEGDIEKYNPVISKKPVPDVSSIKTLSKVSMNIIKEFGRGYDDLTELFQELEENPKIGVNGIKMIEEMCSLYNKIEIPYSCDCQSFSIWRKAEIYEGFNVITKQFNITVKNLINRIIKASFYENLSPLDFINLVTDYIRIAKLLKLAIPEKMPKDIVKDHDLIAAQYEYVKDKIIETQFRDMVKKNKLLLNSLPEHKSYTIISPEVPNDLIEEGLRMRHCVGTYVNRYAAGTSKIFFVRNKAALDDSCVTIELNKRNKLIQARSFANSNPSKEILDFIEKWIDTLE